MLSNTVIEKQVPARIIFPPQKKYIYIYLPVYQINSMNEPSYCNDIPISDKLTRNQQQNSGTTFLSSQNVFQIGIRVRSFILAVSVVSCKLKSAEIFFPQRRTHRKVAKINFCLMLLKLQAETSFRHTCTSYVLVSQKNDYEE